MKTRLSIILNYAFIGLISFCIFLMWTNKILKDNIICLFLSILFTSTVLLIIFILNISKKHKSIDNTKDLQNIELIKYNLLIMSKKDRIDYINKIIENNVEFKQKYFGNSEKLIIILDKEILNYYDILNLLSKHNDNLTIIGIKYESGLNNIVKAINKNIKLINISELYNNCIKPFNLFPKDSVKLKEIKKSNYKELIRLFLKKDKSKSFFFSALILFFYSFLTRYNLYYIVFGTILFCLCIYSKYNKRFN